VDDLLLLSGGLESTALAALERPSCLTIDYGQVPADGEVAAAQAVAHALDLDHHVVRVDLSLTGSGTLASSAPASEAPSEEWWPFRNQLLVTVAAAWALPRGYGRILVGSAAGDAFHQDGTSGFYDLLSALLKYQEGDLQVAAPAIEESSLALLRRAALKRELLGWTFSCHRAAVACGDCPGCNKRRGVLHDYGLWATA
jgi:7-cyano-7-deazaguanine synthase